MVVLQGYHYRRKIYFLILREEKVGNKNELHQDRKRIFQFSKAVCSMGRQQVSQLRSYLKIKIFAAKIIQNKEAYHVQVMLIGWHIRSLGAMKTIVEVDISVQD